MKEIEGMLEDFRQAKVVFLTTFSDKGETSRHMTNFNDSPYVTMWFPTYRDTKKVEAIKRNQRVMITFPRYKEGEFYEIEGRAEFADVRTVEEKWHWWYLYWHPEQKDRFWFPSSRSYPDRMIINVHPVSSRVVRKTEK